MPRPLLLTASLALGSLCTGHAQSSYYFAGQQAGTAYVSLTPPVVLTGQATYSAVGGGTSQSKELDLDQDGRIDLQLSASGEAGAAGRYPSHSANILARHPDIEFYTATASSLGPSGVGLASGDTLQPVMHRRTTAGVLGAWANGSSTSNGNLYYAPFRLSLEANGALGQYAGGDWLDAQEHYVGFRLRTNSAASWRYGWLLAQVTSKSNPVSLTVKSYALASPLLGTRPAQAANWQLYPTQVADQLTIELPTGTSRAQATVVDLCGRALLAAALRGGTQQLWLSTLAAGVYIVQVDTPAGRLSQRISKQ